MLRACLEKQPRGGRNPDLTLLLVGKLDLTVTGAQNMVQGVSEIATSNNVAVLHSELGRLGLTQAPSVGSMRSMKFINKRFTNMTAAVGCACSCYSVYL